MGILEVPQNLAGFAPNQARCIRLAGKSRDPLLKRSRLGSPAQILRDKS